jgi:hypothetical protein
MLFLSISLIRFFVFLFSIEPLSPFRFHFHAASRGAFHFARDASPASSRRLMRHFVSFVSVFSRHISRHIAITRFIFTPPLIIYHSLQHVSATPPLTLSAPFYAQI